MYLYDFINSGDPDTRETCDCEVRDKEMHDHFDRKHGDYNDFWAGRDYLNDIGPMKAALLMSHGWNDWNVMPEHSVRIYEACKQKGLPVQFYCHQGGHGGPPPMKLMNRWFTRYLFGVENGVENDSRAWIVRESGNYDEPTAYPDYPNPDASPVTFHLNKGGNQIGNLTLDTAGSQGIETLIDDVGIGGAALARAESSEHRLLYATPKLTQPVHLSGTSKINIKLACSKPAANLSVWVVSLPWTKRSKIYENIITRGWADPQNYKSLTESQPLEPGQYYEMSFNLQPDDQIIPVDAQIGVMIFSSDRDFTLWPAPGTELTVDLDSTTIEMPVVGGAEALRKAISPQAN